LKLLPEDRAEIENLSTTAVVEKGFVKKKWKGGSSRKKKK
jgi:hypothetical protein